MASPPFFCRRWRAAARWTRARVARRLPRTYRYKLRPRRYGMADADRLKLAPPHQAAKPGHYMRELGASEIEQVSGGWKGVAIETGLEAAKRFFDYITDDWKGGSAFQDGEPYIAANVYGA